MKVKLILTILTIFLLSYPPKTNVAQSSPRQNTNLDSILHAKKAQFEQKAKETTDKVAAAHRATIKAQREFKNFNNQ